MSLDKAVIELTREEQLRIENTQLHRRIADLEQYRVILECALRMGLTETELAQYELVFGRGLVRRPAEANGQKALEPADRS